MPASTSKASAPAAGFESGGEGSVPPGAPRQAAVADRGVAQEQQAARGGPYKRKRAPGSPIGIPEPASEPKAAAEPRDFTNEKLQTHLEAERRRMGITDILSRGAAAPAPAGDAEAGPMNAAEARQYMRAMAEGLARQRRMMPNYKEAVPIGSGSRPRLLNEPADSRAAAGSPILKEPFGGGARGNQEEAGRLQAAAGVAQAPVRSLRYRGPADPQPARPEAADTLVQKDERVEARAGASAAKAAPASMPQAHVARSDAEWRALWRRLGAPGGPPALDFSSEMVVAVSGPATLEIVAARVERGQLVVEYREVFERPGPFSTFRVVPRSDLPVELRRVR